MSKFVLANMKLPQRGKGRGHGAGAQVRETKEERVNYVRNRGGHRVEDQRPGGRELWSWKGTRRGTRVNNKIQNSLAIKYKHTMFLRWVKGGG